MFVDKPLAELETYRPDRVEPADFDAFWATTLAETRTHPLDAQFTAVDSPLQTVDVFDVTFNGYSGQPVKGWLLLPHGANAPLPAVVEFIGYGGGRGLPLEWLAWSSCGYAHLVMDTRGQGSSWRTGDTGDPEPNDAGPHFPGFMTRGILNPETYYYRRLYSDGVRAVAAARSHPAIDHTRIILSGASQGGGLTIAVGALADDIHAILPDVPFLCHIRHATEITDANPYHEITRFCATHRDMVETVFRTLSYFDGVNFAARLDTPAFFSVGLMDDVCPPSTVYAAYNYVPSRKQIRIYAYNGHEGGGVFQLQEKIDFLHDLAAS